MEGLNDVLADVYVLPSGLEDEEPSKRRRVEDENRVEVDADDAGQSLPESVEGGTLHFMDPFRSSRGTGSSAVTDSVEH